jgi:hypothetical protein
MKTILAVGVLTIAGLFISQPSQAFYNGRWCANIDHGAGSVSERCEFATFESCRRYILGESRSFCIQNHWYRPYWTGEPEARYQGRLPRY